MGDSVENKGCIEDTARNFSLFLGKFMVFFVLINGLVSLETCFDTSTTPSLLVRLGGSFCKLVRGGTALFPYS